MNPTPEQFIVDLYEFRATMMKPKRRDGYGFSVDDLHEIEQYNWMNSIIAQLIERYDVSHESITEETRKRYREKSPLPNQ